MNIITLITFPLSLKRKIKASIKLKRFKKRAKCGVNLTVSPDADLSVENGSHIEIGNNCDILGRLIAKCNSTIKVGDFTTIRGNSVIGAACGISIGSHVIISNNVHVYDNNNHSTPSHLRIQMCESGFYSKLWHWSHSDKKEVIIEDNVWIGERSTILKGVTIGKGSIVGCDSVVTHSVPRYCIVAGNPAKIVKYFESDISN